MLPRESHGGQGTGIERFEDKVALFGADKDKKPSSTVGTNHRSRGFRFSKGHRWPNLPPLRIRREPVPGGALTDKFGSERDVGIVFKQERKTFTKFNDESRTELAREVNFDEANICAGRPTGRSGLVFGHPARMH